MSNQKRKFSHFRRDNAEQYAFYRIPKELIKDDYYKSLLCDSKLAFGLMLDRLQLSIKNNWFDEDGNAYIIFTNEDLMEDMNCGHNKACKIMKELEEIGIIKRRKRGLGLPSMIYVMNFAEYEDEGVVEKEDSTNLDTESDTIFIGDFIDGNDVGSQDFRKGEVKSSEKRKSRLPKKGSQEIRKEEVKTSQKGKSRNPKRGNQEFRKEEVKTSEKGNEIRINNSNTEMSNTNQSINPSISSFGEEMDGLKETIAQKISLEELKELAALSDNSESELSMLEEVYDVIHDVISMPDDKDRRIRINSDEVSVSEIKRQYRKLDKYMVSRVLNNVIDKDLHISNMSGYLIAALYNEAKTGVLKNQSGQADEYFRARRGDPYRYVT